MYKVGDIIVCINDLDKNGNPYLGITFGKYYQNIQYMGELDVPDIWVHIINDRFESQNYQSNRFVTVSEFRKMKIHRICSKLETR